MKKINPFVKMGLEVTVILGAMIAFPVAKPYIVYSLIAKSIMTPPKLPPIRTVGKFSNIKIVEGAK